MTGRRPSRRADGGARHSRPYRPGRAQYVRRNGRGTLPERSRPLDAACGLWEPGTRRWLIERRQIRPLVRDLWHNTDPLFRQAGIYLYG